VQPLGRLGKAALRHDLAEGFDQLQTVHASVLCDPLLKQRTIGRHDCFRFGNSAIRFAWGFYLSISRKLRFTGKQSKQARENKARVWRPPETPEDRLPDPVRFF
jgi:hypothetical protein